MWYDFLHIQIWILYDDFVILKPWGGYVFYTYIYIYWMMILRWWDVMRTRWWLHSTTSSYGRLVIEVIYGKILIHSTEVVWEILAREEWLGVSAWCITHVWHTQINTSVGSIYIFSGFLRCKNLYVLCFQIYTYYKKKYWWTLTSS